MPGVRLLDFQQSGVDSYQEMGGCNGRHFCGKNSVYSSFGLVYDTWRFASNLKQSALQGDIWFAVNQSIRTLLDLCSQPQPEKQLGNLQPEVHWSPFLLAGVLPEDAVAHPVFSGLRCTPNTCGDVVHYERQPSPESCDRFKRACLLRHKGALYARSHMIKMFPPMISLRGIVPYNQGTLAGFFSNYYGNARGLSLRCRTLSSAWLCLYCAIPIWSTPRA